MVCKEKYRLNLKAKIKEFNYSYLFNKLYLHIHNLKIEMDKFESILTVTNEYYIYTNIYNILGLDHYNLFRATYVEFLSRPSFYNEQIFSY